MENNTQKTEEKYMPPGMKGYAITDNSGSIIEKNGAVSNSLDQYAAYFNQLGNLLADSLGFSGCEEMILLGKSRHALCMEIDELHYAAVYQAKSEHLEISQFIREKGEENDVLA
jgi:predicted regulator of Ras-like GTPase activity (Roadblock/LC7/MglB family)